MGRHRWVEHTLASAQSCVVYHQPASPGDGRQIDKCHIFLHGPPGRDARVSSVCYSQAKTSAITLAETTCSTVEITACVLFTVVESCVPPATMYKGRVLSMPAISTGN